MVSFTVAILPFPKTTSPGFDGKRAPNMLSYCARCVMPSTKPDLHLDEEGVCNACRAYERRQEVDWDKRRAELIASGALPSAW